MRLARLPQPSLEKQDYRNAARLPWSGRKSQSDKTSCTFGAPPGMKIESAWHGDVNRLFSVDVEVIFVAGEFTGTGQEKVDSG